MKRLIAKLVVAAMLFMAAPVAAKVALPSMATVAEKLQVESQVIADANDIIEGFVMRFKAGILSEKDTETLKGYIQDMIFSAQALRVCLFMNDIERFDAYAARIEIDVHKMSDILKKYTEELLDKTNPDPKMTF